MLDLPIKAKPTIPTFQIQTNPTFSNLCKLIYQVHPITNSTQLQIAGQQPTSTVVNLMVVSILINNKKTLSLNNPTKAMGYRHKTQ